MSYGHTGAASRIRTGVLVVTRDLLSPSELSRHNLVDTPPGFESGCPGLQPDALAFGNVVSEFDAGVIAEARIAAGGGPAGS